MMKRPLSMLYFLAMAIETLIRIPHDRRRRTIHKVERRITRTEYLTLGIYSIGMLGLPLVYSSSSWLDFADFRLSAPAKRRAAGLGTLLFAAAIGLFWRAHHDLGRNWSPSLELGEQHQLITNGVYGSIRHPMYASQWIWSLAQPLLLQNWIAGLAGALLFLPLYLARVPREEQMMLDHFGEAYRAYVARTGAILPRLRRAEPGLSQSS